MSWAEYLQRHTQGETGRVIGEKLGVTESNISRWKKGGQTPDARHVVKFARVYGRPVLEALVEAGYITPAEARQRPAVAPKPSLIDAADLIDELKRRLLATPDARIGNLDDRRDERLSQKRAAYGGSPDTLQVSGPQDQIETGSQDPGDMEPR